MAAIAKRLGEKWSFSGAFGVFLSHYCYFSRVLFGDIEFFRIFAHSKGGLTPLLTLDQ